MVKNIIEQNDWMQFLKISLLVSCFNEYKKWQLMILSTKFWQLIIIFSEVPLFSPLYKELCNVNGLIPYRNDKFYKDVKLKLA